VTNNIEELKNQIRDRLSPPLSSLSPSPYPYYYRDDLKSAQDLRAEDTCKWIFTHKEFEKWRNNATDFLWIYGGPGTGKTVITGKVIDTLMSTTAQDPVRTPLLYFFCNNKTNDTRKNNLTAVLRSLLFQIWTHLCDVEDFSGIWDRILHPDQQESIVMAGVLKQTFSIAPPEYIVIDAVDECEGGEVLVSTLRTLCASAEPKPKVLLTARPEEFRVSKSENDLIIQMSPQNTETDIYHFADAKLEDKKFARLLPSEKEEIKRCLIANASGM
jgi:hypothetical protein